jgi:redox-sensitive bicupin YhaK (pirin superfamily)
MASYMLEGRFAHKDSIGNSGNLVHDAASKHHK